MQRPVASKSGDRWGVEYMLNKERKWDRLGHTMWLNRATRHWHARPSGLTGQSHKDTDHCQGSNDLDHG